MKFIIIVTLLFPAFLHAQLKSGPWAGNISLRTASVWAETDSSAVRIELHYFPAGQPTAVLIKSASVPTGKEFSPVKVHLGALQPSTLYNYVLKIYTKSKVFEYPGSFRTKQLWQYRMPAPDLVFLAGSCSYFNEPVYDRPGKPYGGDSSIFISMSGENAAFNLWLGDSWYYREVDFTPWGMYYRASRDRAQPVLQPLLKKMPQYFTWDDHDYGPNNSGINYIHKEKSRQVFMDYTLNPSYGQDDEGIYSLIQESDVDLFLTDGRWFRSHQAYKDSSKKSFWGRQQMEWLKNSLLESRASFKIIVSGSQVLNPVSTQDCMRHYQDEFNELMTFLQNHNIPGVIFLSGDRHHSEIMKYDGIYTYYDITISPLTSGISSTRAEDGSNPGRVGPQIKQQNYGRISVTGPTGKRKLKCEFMDISGKLIHSWEINQDQLKPVR